MDRDDDRGTGVEPAEVADRLRAAPVEVVGRMPWSSNGTFLVEIVDGGPPLRAVYKPVRGERPLHDFRPGLHRRELASYLLSEALGWDLIPTTVVRADLPFDEGSLQELIEADYDRHYFTIVEDGVDGVQRTSLQRLVVFDVLSNQTDRKSGHVLERIDGRIYGIDNGLSFHAEFKLRTVLWDFAGDDVPREILDDVAALLDVGLPRELAELLDPFERDAVLARARSVVAAERFPVDPTGRRYPWPLV